MHLIPFCSCQVSRVRKVSEPEPNRSTQRSCQLTSRVSRSQYPPRPNAAIEPIVTKEPADAEGSEPCEREPTTANCSAKTDHRPHKKSSGMVELGSKTTFSVG